MGCQAAAPARRTGRVALAAPVRAAPEPPREPGPPARAAAPVPQRDDAPAADVADDDDGAVALLMMMIDM